MNEVINSLGTGARVIIGTLLVLLVFSFVFDKIADHRLAYWTKRLEVSKQKTLELEADTAKYTADNMRLTSVLKILEHGTDDERREMREYIQAYITTNTKDDA